MSLTPKQQRALSLHIEAILVCLAAIYFLICFIGMVSEPVAVIMAMLMIVAIFACLIGLAIGIIRKHWKG